MARGALFWDPAVNRTEDLPPGIDSATPPFISRQVESSRLFFLDGGQADGGFNVSFGGFERCRPDYRIKRKHVPWFCLEFVVSGEGALHLDGVDSVLKPGSFFIYGPGMPHRFEATSDKPLGKYFVGFTGDGAGEFLARYDMPPGFASRCLKVEPIRKVFDTLVERGARKSKLSLPLCNTITRQLLLMCRDDAVEAGNTDTPAFSSYNRAKDFIEKNFLRVTTLDGVATECRLDGPYLCRLFARFHGESPYQFLTCLRMEHAATLLLEKDLTIREVSRELGFSDPFHFSRVFKSVHHVPPSRFRQAMHPQQRSS